MGIICVHYVYVHVAILQQSVVVNCVYRKLINTEVGIDVSVPSHEVASSAKLVKYYHVVVTSLLPHFKSATHSKEDVVQFMVSIHVAFNTYIHYTCILHFGSPGICKIVL